MKAEIIKEGILVVSAENGTDEFALKKWMEGNGSCLINPFGSHADLFPKDVKFEEGAIQAEDIEDAHDHLLKYTQAEMDRATEHVRGLWKQNKEHSRKEFLSFQEGANAEIEELQFVVEDMDKKFQMALDSMHAKDDVIKLLKEKIGTIQNERDGLLRVMECKGE